MNNILIFGGTTEGRELAKFCSNEKIPVTVSTATEYGAELLSGLEYINSISGRLDENQITDYILKNNINLVIDATHPYAVEATENIKKACQKSDIKYLRLIRESEEISGLSMNSISEVVEYLNQSDKNALITTGIKNLSEYTKVMHYRERLAVRVINAEDALNLGFEKVISGDGHFSVEDNINHIRKYNSEILVTKESGKSGGYPEKAKACRICKTDMVTVKRPAETGYSLDEIKSILLKKIYIVGIGMEGVKTLTKQALECIEKSDILIGAERMLKPFENLKKTCFQTYITEEIYNYIIKSDCKKISVLMSGDCGFYSGAEKILKKLEDFDTEVISGISSPIYFCNKIKKPWQNIKFISLHGKKQNILRNIASNQYCFFLLGTVSVGSFCRYLFDCSLSEVKIYVGENLGYDDEKIHVGKIDDFARCGFSKLSVILTENPDYEKSKRSGIPDNEFIRGKIPMTKSEIRSLIISKLEINNDSICWDIGCGTGSVSVEMALQCTDGKVYSVDKNSDAVNLTALNSEKFLCDNIDIRHCDIMEIIEILEAPDKVFIGGSSGKIPEILEIIYKKNPLADVVVTAVSVETLNQSIEMFEKFGITAETVQISAVRTHKIGSHTMFNAENPVFIIKGVKS